MNPEDISERYWGLFAEALRTRVVLLSYDWSPLQPLKVLKLGLHWVVLHRISPYHSVKYFIFATWVKAFAHATEIADAVRKPLALRYAKPV